MARYRIPRRTGLGEDILDTGPMEQSLATLQAESAAQAGRIDALEAQPVAKASGSGGVSLSSATPQALGAPTAGTGTAASRDDHVHAMPSAAAIGADAAGTASGLLAAHNAAADPHPGYLTPAEGNAAYAPIGHVGATGGAHGNAGSGVAGFMSGADKTKLDGIAAGATANATDAALRDRATHTGTQVAATISDFSESVDDRVATLLVAGAGVTLTYNDAANTLTVAASGGGADPWTYVVLPSDFVTNSATAVLVTAGGVDLAFIPDINARYEFEVVLMTRTATTTVGPRPGIAWPTPAQVDGIAYMQQTASAATNVLQNGNISASVLIPVGGVPTTTGSWPATARGVLITGGTVTLGLRIQLASETAGTNVTIKAGSFLKYRTY